MNNRQLLTAMALTATIALSGCYTTQHTPIDVKVTDSLPAKTALAFLNEQYSASQASNPCLYADDGIAGETQSVAKFKTTGFVPFEQWRVALLGLIDNGVQPQALAVMLVLPDGARCNAYYALTGGNGASPQQRNDVQKTMTALVSLGVQYDPNKLGWGMYK